jgi:lambda family phage tail tape measure protein
VSDLTIGITLKADGSGFRGDVKLGDAARSVGSENAKATTGMIQEFRTLRSEIGALIGSYAVITEGVRAFQAIGNAIIEDQQAAATLNAVLKATGGQVGLTADQIEKYAKQLQASSLFDTSSIERAAATLATFSGIAGPTFKEALSLSADLASVMREDLQTAVLQLGKALESPADGLDALNRAGTHFNDEEKALIQYLVDTGRQADAAGVILDKLKGKIGGTAAAQDTGLAGSVHDLADAWRDFLSALGNGAPGEIATGLLDKLTSALTKPDFALSVLGFTNPGMDALIKQRIQQQADLLKAQALAQEQAQRDALIAAGRSSEYDYGIPGPPTLRPDDPTADAKAAEDAAKAAQDRAKAITDYIQGLQFESDQLQRTARDQAIYNDLKQAGVTITSAAGQQIAQLAGATYDYQQRIKDLNAEMDDESKEFASAKAYMESIRDPLDIYIDSVAQLSQWLKDGAISQSQFDQGVQHATDTLNQANQKASDWGQSLRDFTEVIGTAFEDAVVQGKSLSSVLQGLEQDLIRIALRVLVTQPLQSALTKAFNSGGGDLGSSLFGLLFGSSDSSAPLVGHTGVGAGGLLGDAWNWLFSAKGNVFSDGAPVPFRKGGVVTRPTIFPFANGGVGVMGEAGDEAIMPLQRGSDGSLGVRASGGASVEVNIMNTTGQPAQATQRTGSDGRRILDITFGQAAARDIASRGPLAQAVEQAYGLKRLGTRH